MPVAVSASAPTTTEFSGINGVVSSAAVIHNMPPSAPMTAPTLSVPVIEQPKVAASGSGTNQTSLLQFKAKGSAWVQVTDAKGVQLLSRTLQAGEVVDVLGALPLAVVVGRVDLISVELRGKPYDMSAVAQNNIARFEVKQ